MAQQESGAPNAKQTFHHSHARFTHSLVFGLGYWCFFVFPGAFGGLSRRPKNGARRAIAGGIK